MLKILLLFFSINLFAQSKIDPAKFKVFNPNETSVEYNEIYTQNFFFGNFGLKQIVKAIPINYDNVKSLKIFATNDTQNNVLIMELNYNPEKKLTHMKIEDNLMGEPLSVKYIYEDGLIKEEIFTTEDGIKSNHFYYNENKMIVENVKGVLDIYNKKDQVLYKTSYWDGNLVFMDKIEGKCRITQYRKQDINKICFSNFQLKEPLKIEEFTASEDQSGKVILEQDKSLELKKNSEQNYSILNNNKELYILTLDKNNRLEKFDFLGIRSQKVKPITFTFSYTYY